MANRAITPRETLETCAHESGAHDSHGNACTTILLAIQRALHKDLHMALHRALHSALHPALHMAIQTALDTALHKLICTAISDAMDIYDVVVILRANNIHSTFMHIQIQSILCSRIIKENSLTNLGMPFSKQYRRHRQNYV